MADQLNIGYGAVVAWCW